MKDKEITMEEFESAVKDVLLADNKAGKMAGVGNPTQADFTDTL